MKFNILTFLFCLIPLIALAGLQINDEQDYRIYHQQILKAERLLSDEKFGEALDLFEQVFSYYDFVFLKDYKIAAQLALYLDNKEKAFHFIKKGIAGGWELKALKKNRYLAQHLGEPDWKIIEKSYPDLRSEYLSKIDQPTQEMVKTMFKKDQWKALGALLRIGDKAQERYAVKKFAPHSENQITKLIKILGSHGYPGEKLIGNDFWMSTIISHHNSITQEYAKKDTLYSFIKPLLIQSIEQGQMSPYEYALIDDWQKAVSSDKTEAGYGFLNPPNESTLSETNALRQKIGLREIELRNKLVDVEKKTGMNFYLPNWVEGKIRLEQK